MEDSGADYPVPLLLDDGPVCAVHKILDSQSQPHLSTFQVGQPIRSTPYGQALRHGPLKGELSRLNQALPLLTHYARSLLHSDYIHPELTHLPIMDCT